MAQTDEHDVVIVSDLHLSAGYDPRGGAFDRNEDFFYDAAFARFLAYLRARGADEGRRWRLVIPGDLFDFLTVDLQQGLDRARDITETKLDLIAAGTRSSSGRSASSPPTTSRSTWCPATTTSSWSARRRRSTWCGSWWGRAAGRRPRRASLSTPGSSTCRGCSMPSTATSTTRSTRSPRCCAPTPRRSG